MLKAKDRVSDARPYFERALRDQAVRDDLKNAFATARDVYTELFGGRSPTAVATRVATDDEMRDNLRSAVNDLRDAADRVRGREEHTFRNVFLLLVGVALGVLFNPFTGSQTRGWLKDRVFGPEEPFSYEPPQTGDGQPGQAGTAA
jgi:hypothetical protein